MPNSLIHERSLYLQKAANQPIQWLPWSQEALDQAKTAGKAVLLSIGAMWCHWCHVMDHENYEDPDIARLINENFVPIKVDRDEHPEVDRLYQAAVTAMIGEGGWPLTVFLTPEGDVFGGGTYFPPDPRWGQRGFRDLLREIAETYRTAGPSVRASADQIRAAQQHSKSEGARELQADLIEHAVRGMVRDFDYIHGGFGESPRFPHPAALKVLMAGYFRSKDLNLESLLRKSLDSMARGGIHDQIGGGFHRYASGPDWNSPHFEKILSDNAELLRLYTSAATAFQDPYYREIAEGILNWTQSVMTDKDGGFYHSQDADMGPEDDGGYYTWTQEELREALTEKEQQIICAYYAIRNPSGRNVLYNDRTLEDIAEELTVAASLARGLLAAGKEKLYWARKSRLQPAADTTLYTCSNALMISACLEAGHTLKLEEPLLMAKRALDRMIESAWTGDGFAHLMDDSKEKRPGLLEDQVFPGLALLDAFQDSGRQEYLDLALRTAQVLVSRYRDPAAGGFFDVAAGTLHSTMLAAHKPVQDSPAPGANPSTAKFFLRVHSLTGDPDSARIAEETLKAFGALVADWGVFAGTYFLALQYQLEGAFEILIVGEEGHPDADALMQIAWETYRPRKQIHRLTPEVARPDPTVQGMIEFIRLKRKPMAFVCVHAGCAAPVEDPADLRNLILTFNP